MAVFGPYPYKTLELVLVILYLNIFHRALPVTFPAARRAIRLPTLPFLTAFTSPKSRAIKYKIDLIGFSFIFKT